MSWKICQITVISWILSFTFYTNSTKRAFALLSWSCGYCMIARLDFCILSEPKNGQVLKAPPLKSSDLHLSVIECHCRTYDDNIGPNLKKLSFAILGRLVKMTESRWPKKDDQIEKTVNVTFFDNCKRIYTFQSTVNYRTEVCPEIFHFQPFL